MSALEITLTVSIIVLALYAASGFFNYRRSKSYESFFLGDRLLTSENVRNTFAGAAISISTVLVFFLTLSSQFGWQIFISPLTLIGGVLFFAHLIYPRLKTYPKLYDKLKGETEESIDTIGDLVDFFYGSKILSWVVITISGIGMLAVLIAEMMVGVSIYQEYFINPEYIIILVAATLFIYAGFGGIRAVVQTDKWQVWLLMVSLIFVVFASFYSTSLVSEENILLNIDWTPKSYMPIALILNILFVNICFLPSSLRVWQVVSASSRETGFQKGLWGATIIIAVISICAVLISMSIAIIAEGEISLVYIFEYLYSSDINWISMVIYPTFVAALISALVSTADSAILPLAQVLTSKKSENWKQKDIILKVLGLLLLVVGGYFLVTIVFNLGLVAWILTVFSVTTCIAPPVFMPLFLRERKYSSFSIGIIGTGMILGCSAALFWSVYHGNDLIWQPWNCVIGIGISTLFTLVGCFNPTNEKINEEK